MALEIPAVSACIDYIANTISSIPVKLYKQEDNRVIEITDDDRLFLLNKDTGDTLTATQFWKAIIQDYLLSKGGYVYINRDSLMNVQSLHYVDSSNISVIHNTDPIFKTYDIYCQGIKYAPYNFIKILLNTNDGMTSTSIVARNKMLFAIMYYCMQFELKTYKSGGRRKGLISRKDSTSNLSKEALALLKNSWNDLYNSDSENAVILPPGCDFKEITDNLKDMEINNSRESMSAMVCMLLRFPKSLLWGNATPEDNKNYIKYCVVPILNDIESSLDRDLLTEKEKKQNYFFAFDTKELMRGDIKERYEAYKVAIDEGFLTRNEVRNMEDLEEIDGLDVISYTLANVLYDPVTKTYFTPNTSKVLDKNNKLKGGETEIEAGNKE